MATKKKRAAAKATTEIDASKMGVDLEAPTEPPPGPKYVRDVCFKLGAPEQCGELKVGPCFVAKVDRAAGEIWLRAEDPSSPLWHDRRAIEKVKES